MKFSIVIFLLTCQATFGQSFTTRISPKIIGKEDVLQVEYVADNVTIDQFNLPRFVNWTIVSGPNVSSSKIVSGSTVKEQTIYSVMLQPQRTGTIIIPAASALINNKPQRSNEVSVQVRDVSHVGGQPSSSNQPSPSLFDLPPTPGAVSPNQYLQKGENAVDKIKHNIFVRLEVSKQTCYAGEPVMATYKLCTRLKSKSKVVKQPTFSGCTVVELTPSYQEQHIEKINGQEYNVFVIRRVQLIPLNAGQLTLPSTAVENDVSFYKAGKGADYDVFGNARGETEDEVVTMENKSAVITIKPLPPYTGSDPFSGAVGNFNIELRAAEPTFSTNGTNHLFFLVEGTGNLQPVKSPVINWPKGIEAFESTINEETDKESSPPVSRKVFTIPFVADKMGNYVLPPVPFTYFDPGTEKYVTKATQSFLFKVMPGSKNSIINKVMPDNLGDFDQRLFVILGAALLAVIIGIAWYSGTRRSKLPPEIKLAEKDKENEAAESVSPARKPDGGEFLYKIHGLLPDENTSSFYKQLGKNLDGYLFHKFKIQPSQINDFAEQHLTLSPLLHQLKMLMKNCTLGMYTPVFRMEEALQHRLEAIDVLEKLERES